MHSSSWIEFLPSRIKMERSKAWIFTVFSLYCPLITDGLERIPLRQFGKKVALAASIRLIDQYLGLATKALEGQTRDLQRDRAFGQTLQRLFRKVKEWAAAMERPIAE